VNAGPPATRYEINDFVDRCREKLLDFFIALRREIEADLWIERKMQEMKYEIRKMLWECEIGRRGVRSRTTAGASSSDS
jgi:hypothetical protein